MNEERFNDWFNELPILTYGELDRDNLLNHMEDILTWKEQGLFISDEIPETINGQENLSVMEYWLILGLLNNCIDYGSSPRGAWLTDLGKEVLEYLRTNHI